MQLDSNNKWVNTGFQSLDQNIKELIDSKFLSSVKNSSVIDNYQATVKNETAPHDLIDFNDN